MPSSAELYLVLKAMNLLGSGGAGPSSPGVLSEAPPPQGTNAPELEMAGDTVAHVPPTPPAPAQVLGLGTVTHVPPWPPAPMHVAVVVDHVPPTPPAPMHVPASVEHVPPWPPAPMQEPVSIKHVPPWPPAPSQATKPKAHSVSGQAHAQAPAPLPTTVLSVVLDDQPLQPPKSLLIQSVTIYGSREMALAWLKSADGQEFAKDAQALQLLRISADDES